MDDFGQLPFLRVRKNYRGQNFAAFLMLFFLIIMFFAVVGDFSRWMAATIKARDLADNAALAAAGSIDASQFNNGTVVINTALATERAQNVINYWLIMRYPEERFINLSLSGLEINGRVVSVTVSGKVDAVFGKFLGFSSYPVSRTASARLMIGIEGEQ